MDYKQIEVPIPFFEQGTVNTFEAAPAINLLQSGITQQQLDAGVIPIGARINPSINRGTAAFGSAKPSIWLQVMLATSAAVLAWTNKNLLSAYEKNFTAWAVETAAGVFSRDAVAELFHKVYQADRSRVRPIDPKVPLIYAGVFSDAWPADGKIGMEGMIILLVPNV